MRAKILDRGTVFQSEDAFGYSGWPTVAKLPDGSIGVAFSGNHLWHICPFGRTVMVKSTDNGKTWSTKQTVINTLLDDRDGGICVFGENRDKVIVTSFTHTPEKQIRTLKMVEPDRPAVTKQLISVYESYKDYLYDRFGEKEIKDKCLGGTYAISYDSGKTFKDFGLLPISSPHGPNVDKDGSLIFVGRGYMEKKEYGNIKAPGLGFWMYRSKNGIDWSEPTLVMPLTQEEYDKSRYSEGTVIVTESGRILVHIRSNNADIGKHGTYQTYSDDGGKTFAPVKLIVDKGFPSHMLKLKNNSILMAYGYRFDDMGLRARISNDNGDSWSDEIILLSGAENDDIGYPSTIELDDGTFLTTFYQIENGKRNAGIYYIKWTL